MNYSDLLDPMGGLRGGSSRRNTPEVEPLATLDAGTIDLEFSDGYVCTPNELFRGQIRLIWKNGNLQWQLYNRKTQKVESTTVIPTEHCENRRLELLPAEEVSAKDPKETNEKQRIYVYHKGPPGEYEMYWMQRLEDEKEKETIEKINGYLQNPSSARPADEVIAAATAASADSDSGTNAAQVDALSNILENLGMPQDSSSRTASAATTSATTSESAAAASGATATPTGTLTLADLQGAMAGIQNQPSSERRPLDAIVSTSLDPETIEGLMADEAARDRLIALLPPEQQSPEALREHFSSPQVSQTLRALTQALLPDDTGNMDTFYSVLANFSLDPSSANPSNPIQAFLDAILASVEKDKEDDKKGDEDGKSDEMEQD